MADNQLQVQNKNPTEVWKEIPGYEGYYEASTFGNIRSMDRILNCPWGEVYPAKGKPKAMCKDKYGYLYVGLSKGRKKRHLTVHRLIALTFIPNPNNKPCIDHIDGDKTNNRVDNLRWCSVKENNSNPITRERHKNVVHTEERNRKVSLGLMGHKVTNVTRKKISDYRKSTARKVRQFTLDGKLVAEWNNTHEAAKSLNINHNTMVSLIKHGKRTKGYYIDYIFKFVENK